jgi:RHS repeat-associated protein
LPIGTLSADKPKSFPYYKTNAAEYFSFDAWGKRRNVDATAAIDDVQYMSLSSQLTNNGFTGHEQLDPVGLVHMGGRVYDPTIGRFLSADPFIQAPDSTQSYNRYSYVMNNPLSLTDPTGYFSIGGLVGNVFGGLVNLVKAIVRINLQAVEPWSSNRCNGRLGSWVRASICHKQYKLEAVLYQKGRIALKQ